jgi:hypothetical protein
MILRASWKTKILVLGGVFALAGCQPKTGELFPDYVDDTRHVNQVFRMHDVFIVSDVSGKEHVLHLPENVETLDWVEEAVREIVEAKGYEVSDNMVMSVGMSSDMDVLVDHDGSKKNPGWGSADELEREEMPAAVDLRGIDRVYLDDIEAVHGAIAGRRVMDMATAQSMGNPIMPEPDNWMIPRVDRLGLPEDSVLVVTQSHGVQVPFGKKFAQGFFSTLLTLGNGAGWDSDTTAHQVYILHPKTGEVLWADGYVETGGNRSRSAIRNGLNKLFDELPDKGEQVAPKGQETNPGGV